MWLDHTNGRITWPFWLKWSKNLSGLEMYHLTIVYHLNTKQYSHFFDQQLKFWNLNFFQLSSSTRRFRRLHPPPFVRTICKPLLQPSRPSTQRFVLPLQWPLDLSTWQQPHWDEMSRPKFQGIIQDFPYKKTYVRKYTRELLSSF